MTPMSQHEPDCPTLVTNPPPDPIGGTLVVDDLLVAANADDAGSLLSGVPQPGPAGMPNPRDPFPPVGATFLGFRIEAELGRGAFGRVYLARQADLSGRPVALKVAPNIVDESRTLAQLQHTNVVPIYSYHRHGGLQAACMPFYGRTTLGHVVASIAGRKTLPSSGRELKSTVNQGRLSTLPSAGTPSSRNEPGADHPEPSAEPCPAPSQPAIDGWARLDGLSYVEAVLWLAEQLADGLAHAHARGILHRDLKPANVLLTDEGRPMLLDFNLAEDTKRRGGAEAARVGGTLLYMPPEQMDAFQGASRALDGRSDVYSLGVILFELLTGRFPFRTPPCPRHELIPRMIADRQQPPPSARSLNADVSPATDAIVRKCLAPNPADRYQSMEQLREDLDRQLNHQPLKHTPEPSLPERARKWVRRHPRLTSTASVAAAAAVVLVALSGAALYALDRAGTDRARAVHADHRAAFADAQLAHDDRHQSRPRLDESLAKFRGLLARYGVPEGGADDAWLSAELVRRLPPAEQATVRAEVGEAFYMMAQDAYLRGRTTDDARERADLHRTATVWHTAAKRYAADNLPRALLQQRADLAALAGDASAAALAESVETTAPGSARDQVLLGIRFAQTKQSLAAVRHLRAATRLDPTNLSGWFVRGTVHLDQGEPEAAAECFSACISLRPGFAPAWLNRGLAYARLNRHAAARDEYDRAIELDPKLAAAYVERAFVRDALGDSSGAADDFGLALDAGGAGPRVYFLRANVRKKLGDHAGARDDFRAGLALPCGTDELNWVARSEVRLEQLDAHAAAGGAFGLHAMKAAALADVGQALRLNPESQFALQQQAHVLSVHFGRDADARAALDQLVRFHPDSAHALVDRAVLLARAGDRAAAIRDAEAAMRLDSKPPTLYQAACVFAQTSRRHPDDKADARRLLWGALRSGYGLDYVDTDTDLDPLRRDPAFQTLVNDARRLQAELPR
jgi:serine/threonine protein kinase/Tfp pilus assembly protein PilF